MCFTVTVREKLKAVLTISVSSPFLGQELHTLTIMSKNVNKEANFGADQNQSFWDLASLTVEKVEAIEECVRTNSSGHFGIDQNDSFWKLAAIDMDIIDLIAEQNANITNNTPKKQINKTKNMNCEYVCSEFSESAGGQGIGGREEDVLFLMTRISLSFSNIV